MCHMPIACFRVLAHHTSDSMPHACMHTPAYYSAHAAPPPRPPKRAAELLPPYPPPGVAHPGLLDVHDGGLHPEEWRGLVCHQHAPPGPDQLAEWLQRQPSGRGWDDDQSTKWHQQRHQQRHQQQQRCYCRCCGRRHLRSGDYACPHVFAVCMYVFAYACAHLSMRVLVRAVNVLQAHLHNGDVTPPTSA